MTNQPISKEIMLNISKYGIYYNPASKHYNSNTNVVCDRCFKHNISTCIGWQTYDLCLVCVNTINNDFDKDFVPTKPNKPVGHTVHMTTNMMQGQFRDEPNHITKMLQHQYRKDPGVLTQMKQAQFRNYDTEDDYKTYMMQSQFRDYDTEDNILKHI